MSLSQADAEAPEYALQSRDAVGALYAALILCLGLAGLLVPAPQPKPKPDFTLAGWETRQDELAALFDTDLTQLKMAPPGDSADRVITAYELLGQLEAQRPSKEREETVQAHSVDTANLIIDYWFTEGEQAYRNLGTLLYLRFDRALEQALVARAVDGATLSRWLVDHKDHPLVANLRTTSGTFIEFALGSGLLSERGQMAGGSPALLRLHFQGRWYLFLQSIRDYMLLYRREELLAKWRWSLEGDRNVSMDTRVEKARLIRTHDPSYPVYASLGALYAKRGQTLRAIDAYRNALLEDPFNTRVGANLRFLVDSQ